MNRNPAIALLDRSLRAEAAPAPDDGRRALTHPKAIIIRMADDICALREQAVERGQLRRFGWTDAQIDGWFESALEEADALQGVRP